MKSTNYSNDALNSFSGYISGPVRVVDAIIFSSIAMTGIIGNVLVFVAYVLSHKIRTKTNVFVLNLAFADFVTCTFLPFISWTLLREIEDVTEPEFDTACGVIFAVIAICVLASNILLFGIAVNRYVLITRSHQAYKRLYGRRNLFLWLLASWTYPFVVNLVPLLFGVGHLGFDITIHACGPKTDHENSYIYDVIVVTSALPLPFVISMCYVGIFLHIRKHNRRMRRYTRNLQDVGLSSDPKIVRSGRIVDKAYNREVNLDITKNLFVVLLTYLVCVSPHIVCEIVDAPPFIILHTRMLVACNSCLNPIIYAVKHPHFRQVFKCIILRRWTDIPQPVFDFMKIKEKEHGRDADSDERTSTHFSYNTMIISHAIKPKKVEYDNVTVENQDSMIL